MPHIVLEQVEKAFGHHQVLPPLDLDLDDGEFTVLVGPSGCGKSTTLRLLAGLENLTAGEIYFDDQPISDLEPKDRDVAMVFQDYALYPHMNVAKNMSFALRLARVPKAEIEEKVKRVAAMLNIQDYLHRKPAELSGGQRQRVAMGRVLVRDAGTFLFDEPLSNLDAQLRAKMRTELAEMRDKIDKNMIYVTHDQTEAMTLGDRIVVMKGGVIQQQGSPEELFKRPANKFVAGFIGSPPMNFLNAELEGANGGLRVKGEGFDLPLSDEQRSRLDGTTLGGSSGSARQVEIGIRPSAFNADAEAGAPVDLHLVVSEYLGAHSVLVTRCGGEDVLVEYDSATPMKSGTTMTFGIRSDDIMLFDRGTGATL